MLFGKRDSVGGLSPNFTLGASILPPEFGLPKQKEVPCYYLRKAVIRQAPVASVANWTLEPTRVTSGLEK